MNKKAQTFILDLIVSAVIFMAVIGIIMYLWDSNIYEIKKSELINDMKKSATNGAEMLMRTPGAPDNWYTQQYGNGSCNITSIGLTASSSDRQLNLEKTCAFMNMGIDKNISYSCARYKLVGKSYEFYVSLTDLNNNPLNLSFCSSNCDGKRCYVGNRNYTSATDLFTVTRTGILNNTIVKLHFTIHVKNIVL